jgi:hypothetical protein
MEELISDPAFLRNPELLNPRQRNERLIERIEQEFSNWP